MKILNTFLFYCIFINANSCTFDIQNSRDLKTFTIKDCTTIHIKVHSGEYDIKTPINFNLTNTKSLFIDGDGRGNTNLYVSNNLGAIFIYSKQRNTKVEISNLSIFSKEQNISSAISFRQPPGGNQHIRNIVLRNIDISNYNNSPNLNFKKAITIVGAWRVLIDNVFVSGFFGPKAKDVIPKIDICFNLEETYSPTIVNSRCWNSKIGLNLISRHNPGPEGLMVSHSKFVNTQIGINIDFISKEPGGFITENHINAIKYGIKVKNRKFLIINENLMYRHEKSIDYQDISLNNVTDSIISNNIFHYPKKKNDMDRKEINLFHSKNNVISNNLFTKRTKMIFGNSKMNKINNNFISH